MLPGPGSLLAIAAEITLAESMPWAMRVSKMVVAAYSALMCRALLSPDTAANRTMSASVIVLAKVADMPILQIGEFVAAKLVHGTVLSASAFEGDTGFGIRARSVRSAKDARMAARGRPALPGCRATTRFVCSLIKAFTFPICRRRALRP